MFDNVNDLKCYRCGSWPCGCRDGQTILHGDARELLPLLPKVDLILTDPPYGVGMEKFADDFETVSAINLAPGTIAAVFMSPRRLKELFDVLVDWSFERLLWMHKTADIAFPWRGWCMNSEAIALFSRAGATWQKDIKCRPDVYSVGPWDRVSHPACKPLAVVSDLAARLSATSIIDPFMGSGTTLRAAKDLGRKCVGIDIEERWCACAARRLEQEVLF